MKLEDYKKLGYIEIASLPYKKNKRIVKCVRWKEDNKEEIYLVEELTLLDCEECKDEKYISLYFKPKESKKIF